MLQEKDVVSKDEVIAQMMHNWQVKKDNDQQLAGQYVIYRCISFSQITREVSK